MSKGYLVAAPSLDILSKLEGSNMNEANLRRIPEVESRKIAIKISEQISKCALSIIVRKNKPKEQVEKAYYKLRLAVLKLEIEKAEVALRYLRTARVMLCHDYCDDLGSQIASDCMRLELLNDTNLLRQRAYLLPKDSIIFKMPRPDFGEQYFSAYDHNKAPAKPGDSGVWFWDE